MGNFEVKTIKVNTTYGYTNESVSVEGNYTRNGQTNDVVSISGQVRTISGLFIGSFNGYGTQGSLTYSTSDVPDNYRDVVNTAISEVQSAITAQEGGEE